MDRRKKVLKQTAVIGAGQLLCSAITVAVFYGLGKFTMPVLWSSLGGAGVMVLNHLFLAITVELAADKAVKGEVEQAKKMVSLSSAVRLFCIAAALFLGVWLGGNVIALALPLALTRPILMVTEFFGKKGD